MEPHEVMLKLESLGNARNATIYKSQGAGEDVFGVSLADLKKLKKHIGTDHDCAIDLWNSGNSDARSLAMMIADPDEVTPTVATQWMKESTYQLHAMEVAAVVSKSPTGISKMRQWRKQKSDYARTTGYAILMHILNDDPDAIDELECRRIMKEIETEIHRSPNNARHAMVMAVIAIGIHKEELTEEVIEAGERIGDVVVDYGETNYKTPKIVACINKALKRSAGKAKTPPALRLI